MTHKVWGGEGTTAYDTQQDKPRSDSGMGDMDASVCSGLSGGCCLIIGVCLKAGVMIEEAAATEECIDLTAPAANCRFL